MPGRNVLKYLSLVLWLALCFIKAGAQNYSYIFLQADKDIEFRIKMNNGLLPQYGRNYVIIPKLPAGIAKFYILFPKNDYPAQRFILEIPEKGFRNFLLTRYQGSIALYDIQSLSYQSGETISVQQMEADMPKAPVTAANTDSPALLTEIGDSSLIIKKTPKQETVLAEKTNEPVNIGGIADEYNKPLVKKDEPVSNTRNETGALDTGLLNDYYNNPVNNPKHVKIPIPGKTDKKPIAKKKDETEGGSISLGNYSNKPLNTAPVVSKAPPVKENTSRPVKLKCTEPIATKAYDDIYIKSLQKSDNDRLKFLLGNLKNCFTSSQVRVLTTTLSTDPERYAFLKQAYSHVTDKGNFAALESTLSKPEWKDYFELLLQ